MNNKKEKKTCIYELTRNSSKKQKGDLCGEIVARYPNTEGKDYCRKHQPISDKKADECIFYDECGNRITIEGDEEYEKYGLACEKTDLCKDCLDARPDVLRVYYDGPIIKKEDEKNLEDEDSVTLEEETPIINEPFEVTTTNPEQTCEWRFKSGKRKGERCDNEILGANVKVKGSDLYCKKCVKKQSVKSDIIIGKTSPTFRRIERDYVKLENADESLYSRKIFLQIDFDRAYMFKNIDRTIHSDSGAIIANLEFHWKFIIETLTMKDAVEPYTSAVLLWASRGKYAKGQNNTYWKLDEENQWKQTDKKLIKTGLRLVKNTLISQCINMIKEKQKDMKNKPFVQSRSNDVIRALQIAMTIPVKKYIISEVFSMIEYIQLSSDEDIIGKDFIREMIIFTNDDKDYNLATTDIFECREKWILNNPETNIKSYREIGANTFGKILKRANLWKMDFKSHSTKHLGIKLNENM